MTKPLVIKPRNTGQSSAVEDFVSNSLCESNLDGDIDNDWDDNEEESEEEYAYCTLHPEYFTFALHLLAKDSDPRLSSTSWNNVGMFRVIQKQ